MSNSPFKNIREARNLSQRAVATATKLSQVFISECESGKKNLGIPNLQKLIAYYDKIKCLSDKEKELLVNYYLFSKTNDEKFDIYNNKDMD